MTIQTSYLQHVFNPNLFQRTVDKTIKEAERLKKETKFDTIAFSGISGSAMAFLLSHWLDVPLLCVRKLGENSHYHKMTNKVLEGNVQDMQRYLIVDDFVASGATVLHIVNSIMQVNYNVKCVGLLMYSAYSNSEFKHPDWSCSVPVISSRPEDS